MFLKTINANMVNLEKDKWRKIDWFETEVRKLLRLWFPVMFAVDMQGNLIAFNIISLCF